MTHRLGVVGTMVWDTIYGRGPTTEPVDEWGGIAYALAALEAALADDWEIVPLVRVGRDLAPRANAFLHQLTRRAAAARFIEVPEPNNRVTLRYTSAQRRTERLTGGVTQAGDRLFTPLRMEVSRRAFKPAVDACRIVPGELLGTAGVYGAAAAFLVQRRGPV